MSHYFSEDNDTLKSNPKVIAFSVNDINMRFNTDSGVFAKDGFDRGTKVLLEFLEISSDYKTALDLGCGYGVIGIYLNKAFDIKVDMVDINDRAIRLSKENVILNNAQCNVFKSDGYSNIKDTYDLIVTNPPIRAGKKIIYRFFKESINYLNENGAFVIVINKKHGAESAFKYLQTVYNIVEIVGKHKGFQVIICKKPLTI